MRKKEFQNKGKSAPLAIGIGVGISCLLMLLGVLVTTVLLTNQTIEESAIGYGVMIATIISALAGCTGAIAIAQNRIMIVSACTALAFALVLLAITAMFFGGQYSGVGATMLIIIGSGVSAALVAGKYFNQPKKYRKKR